MEHAKHIRRDILADVLEKIKLLTTSQQKFLHEMLAAHEKASTAASKKNFLKKSFGIWADRKDIKDSAEYVNEMRAKWESRLAGIKG